MMTFRGPAEKCEFEPLSYENLVFAVQRDPRIAPNFDVFSEGRSGGSVWRSETPKMPTEADFGGFRADSGAPFAPIFGIFRGPYFDRIFDRIFGSNFRYLADGVRPVKQACSPFEVAP